MQLSKIMTCFAAFTLSASALPCASNYSLALISARTDCTAGTVVCNGPTQFGLCNPPHAIIFQQVAAGMMCSDGQMVASTVGLQAGGSSSSGVSGTGSNTPAPSATPLPVSTTIIVTSTATVTISSSTATSAPPTSTTAALTTSTPATPPSSTSAAPSASSAPAPASTGKAVSYTGDGSVAQGWPAMSDWVSSFDTLYDLFLPSLMVSCSQFGQSNNSPDEIANLKSAIQSIGQSTGVDSRFILAIVQQESGGGCVRAWSTSYSVVNPGLMQSHEGSHSCNTDQATDGVVVKKGVSQTPCPASEITGMITDGVSGTSSGPGLQQLLKSVGGNDAQAYYKVARMYNSGSIPADGNLSGAGATASYASDVANKLLGIVPV